MTIVPHKTCTRCGQSKPLDEFGIERKRPDGHAVYCKVCRRAMANDRYQKKPRTTKEGYKRCYMCREEKPLDQFHRDRNAKDGHQRQCKDCHRVWVRGYVYEYEQRRRERDPDYNIKWLAYKRRKSKEWRDQNPEKEQLHRQKMYRRISENPELRAKYTDFERERRQERQRTDPAYHRHLMKLAKEGQSRRRARLAGGGGSHTEAEWIKLCEQYDHRCLCCGEQKPLTEDHIRPVSKGGSDNIDNIQPLCEVCNKRKGTKTIDYRPASMGSDV